MGLLDKLLTAKQGDDVVDAMQRIATAFERIAAVAETFLPQEVHIEHKPLGPEAIGTYGQELEPEDVEDMRAKLREAGLSDSQIDAELMKAMFTEDDDPS